MNTKSNCQSCGMPVDDGLYCQYCVDKSGNLQSFEERFERMVQWTMKEQSGINRQEAEQLILPNNNGHIVKHYALPQMPSG